MKITVKQVTQTIVKFVDLDYGDVFKFYDRYYIKAANSCVVDLSDGKIYATVLEHFTPVIPVKAELVIEEERQ